MARILVSDPIAEAGIEVLRQAGEVDVRTRSAEGGAPPHHWRV